MSTLQPDPYEGNANIDEVAQRIGSPNSQSVNSNNICRYFNYGICRFGVMCRFEHILNENFEIGSTNRPSESVTSKRATNTTTNIIATDPNSWVMAPVFVPKRPEPVTPACVDTTTTHTTSSSTDNSHTQNNQPKSYAEVVGHNNDTIYSPNVATNQYDILSFGARGSILLCPYIRSGELSCPNGDLCRYDHGDFCDMCGRYCLHPTDAAQRKTHQNACIRQHETDMELSFAIARSKDKTCGVCFEIIMEKSGREKRFGILPNCNHIFCLECIRKWRQEKQFDNKIIRACPECRVTSDFVCPSLYWVDTKEEKAKLLSDYRTALCQKDCKYFKQGRGKCPFGNKCFYKHALPNGVRVDVGVPQRQVRRQNHMGEIDVLQQLFLWDFMDDHDQQWLDELASFLTESEDSDWSDYDFYEVDNVMY